MSIEEKAKAYDEALEKTRIYRDNARIAEDYIAVARYENIFPEIREKPLTPFQQCLNCILRGVYYAEVPDEEVNEFILNVVRTRTDELIKLAKRHEYTDCQLHESEDERIRKYLVEELKAAKSVGELKFIIPQPTREECITYLEKQKEHHIPWYDYQKSKEAGYTIVPNEEYEQLIKQKEQKHPNGCFTCDEYKKGYDEGRRNGFTAGYNKAMKEVEQKEQKPAEDKYQQGLEATYRWQEGYEAGFNAASKPAEWSEEDADILNCCISSIEEAKENRYAYKETDGDTSYDREIAFLKSLRPSWKPSEEQMDALKELIDDAKRAGWVTPGATELYEQLKKLM